MTYNSRRLLEFACDFGLVHAEFEAKGMQMGDAVSVPGVFEEQRDVGT